MLYEIDFEDNSEGLYSLKDITDFDCALAIEQPTLLHRRLMITTDPDLEGYSCVVDVKLRSDYFPITMELFKSGNVSVDAVKLAKHWVLVGGKWEVRARLKKVHDSCFEFSFSGGERLYVSEFALGEPDE